MFKEPTTEADLQSLVLIETSKRGTRLWRNNVGCLQNPKTGQFVRYGLCNSSKKLNDAIKSSDLVGITPIVITQEMVGQTVGVFTSYELKHPGWKYTGQGREVAQEAWLSLVRSLGGIARFVSSLGDV